MTQPSSNARDRACPARPQKSRSNVFPPAGGRGRSASSAHRAHGAAGDPALRRDAFMQRWSRLMLVSFASPEACALWANVTVQAARNWMDGFNRPYGDVVDLAVQTLPDYARIMGEG